MGGRNKGNTFYILAVFFAKQKTKFGGGKPKLYKFAARPGLEPGLP